MALSYALPTLVLLDDRRLSRGARRMSDLGVSGPKRRAMDRPQGGQIQRERSTRSPSSCSAAALQLSPQRRRRREAPSGVPQARRGFARSATELTARKGTIAPLETKRRAPAHPSQACTWSPSRRGVSPRPPRLDRLPALRRQVADQVGRLLIGDSAETRGPTGFCRCVGGLDLQFHPSSYT